MSPCLSLFLLPKFYWTIDSRKDTSLPGSIFELEPTCSGPDLAPFRLSPTRPVDYEVDEFDVLSQHHIATNDDVVPSEFSALIGPQINGLGGGDYDRAENNNVAKFEQNYSAALTRLLESDMRQENNDRDENEAKPIPEPPSK